MERFDGSFRWYFSTARMPTMRKMSEWSLPIQIKLTFASLNMEYFILITVFASGRTIIARKKDRSADPDIRNKWNIECWWWDETMKKKTRTHNWLNPIRPPQPSHPSSHDRRHISCDEIKSAYCTIFTLFQYHCIFIPFQAIQTMQSSFECTHTHKRVRLFKRIHMQRFQSHSNQHKHTNDDDITATTAKQISAKRPDAVQ